MAGKRSGAWSRQLIGSKPKGIVVDTSETLERIEDKSDTYERSSLTLREGHRGRKKRLLRARIRGRR